jgi:hypothetical protein
MQKLILPVKGNYPLGVMFWFCVAGPFSHCTLSRQLVFKTSPFWVRRAKNRGSSSVNEKNLQVEGSVSPF